MFGVRSLATGQKFRKLSFHKHGLISVLNRFPNLTVSFYKAKKKPENTLDTALK